jgi:NhaP-type Na+/H+ or K+/H+ antiporter
VNSVVSEALGSVLLGLGLSWAAAHLLPHRLPARRTVFLAGTLGAMFGAYLTHMALGPGHGLAALAGATTVGAVVLSLLLRPTHRRFVLSPSGD